MLYFVPTTRSQNAPCLAGVIVGRQIRLFRAQVHYRALARFRCILYLEHCMRNVFMERAIELAIENVRSGRGGPFGAVVVRGGEIAGTGVNSVTASNDPTAHAEVMAIREACRQLGAFQLSGCDLYTSCEPCPMCLGAIYWARLDRVFYGGTRDDAAQAGFDDAFIYDQLCSGLVTRSMPMEPLMRAEAIEAFREWERSGLKIPY